ncbi:MAG TPA: thioredoxin domain-containing protein [Pyrinomonadaceae bacterium]|nr:thioredoxin domain-containing protein [Pyrinomonadaceae bacterium]
MKPTLIIILAFLLFPAAHANALVLRGVVSEVRDGQTIVVVSGGRKLFVVLKGVASPELKQEFGEVSQQYLASLVLDKAVEVDFSQLASDHVVGKVFCNKLDIGLQVIRDGSAWFDKTSGYSLSEAERTVYANAQEAARGEMRGLWRDGSPMPPWEWRRAQLWKSTQPVAATYKRSERGGLDSSDIVFSGRKVGTNSLANPAGKSSARGSSALPPKSTAKPLNRPGQDFDFRSYLNQGRISIVYFYADWCPACRGLSPVMEAINRQIPDMQVLFMDIGDWNTPVTQQYGITSVPYLRIYDQSGNLVASGREAKDWLLRETAKRK